MVEFDSIESATRARENLNGCDIYSSCCTLKIDFAKVSDKLWKILRSDSLFCDRVFTNNSVGLKYHNFVFLA